MSASRATAVGLALGSIADLLLADPRRGHPVAGFGRAAGALERRIWRDDRATGAAYTAVCVGTATALGAALARVTAGSPSARTAVTALATWAVLGGTSLDRAAATMAQHLEAGDLAAARGHLPTLAGRDPSALGEPELVRATVESVAENTSDAAVAPLFWGAVAGLPGLLGYRAANTLDAMVGYRSARYARFGWASARLDDVLNWVPARLTAALTVAAAPAAGGSAAGAWRAWRRDGAAHPSPNAGRCEAALAGALDLRLGGRNVYGSRVEERPPLGDGQPPTRADIRRAARLSRAVWTTAAILAAASRALPGRVRRGPRG
ncbi:cobalamin biosynthesis protein [Modestobacter roseus]|uniref:Cobalamin biosynthesis protein CobD n=1 Tax=Modestobacter roseus TaxID=1181884 RepID=A0A562IXG4_9ACTN|nr:cobalamin biosynthesis protein [Modestobacter roseus]MQA33981.1 cobalamin biosynthesis protein [Modestobacter roseus]TWH75530.1 adenosylcobinamide-phosphate synthase [Modestobacter roseus]